MDRKRLLAFCQVKKGKNLQKKGKKMDRKRLLAFCQVKKGKNLQKKGKKMDRKRRLSFCLLKTKGYHRKPSILPISRMFYCHVLVRLTCVIWAKWTVCGGTPSFSIENRPDDACGPFFFPFFSDFSLFSLDNRPDDACGP